MACELPAVCVAVPVITKLDAVVELTTTLKVFEFILPSVVVILAVSALYNTIEPLLPLVTVATPLVKVMVVPFPKATAVPNLSVIVGADPEVELFAPPNVKDLSPVYTKEVFPDASFAVIVNDCAAPAVCVPLPVITKLVAALELIVTKPLVPV